MRGKPAAVSTRSSRSVGKPGSNRASIWIPLFPLLVLNLFNITGPVVCLKQNIQLLHLLFAEFCTGVNQVSIFGIGDNKRIQDNATVAKLLFFFLDCFMKQNFRVIYYRHGADALRVNKGNILLSVKAYFNFKNITAEQ